MYIIYPSQRLLYARKKCMWTGSWPLSFNWIMYRNAEIIKAKYNIILYTPER